MIPIQPILADRSTPLLVRIALIKQPKEREQRHLQLLRRRQSRRMIQRNPSALSDHPVDELQPLGSSRQ